MKKERLKNDNKNINTPTQDNFLLNSYHEKEWSSKKAYEHNNNHKTEKQENTLSSKKTVFSYSQIKEKVCFSKDSLERWRSKNLFLLDELRNSVNLLSNKPDSFNYRSEIKYNNYSSEMSMKKDEGRSKTQRKMMSNAYMTNSLRLSSVVNNSGLMSTSENSVVYSQSHRNIKKYKYYEDKIEQILKKNKKSENYKDQFIKLYKKVSKLK